MILLDNGNLLVKPLHDYTMCIHAGRMADIVIEVQVLNLNENNHFFFVEIQTDLGKQGKEISSIIYKFF